MFRQYPERKYERASYRNIAEVLWNEAGEEAIDQFLRRLTFSALIGNADMQLKNLSLIYPDRVSPTLAPAYDLLSTIVYLPDETMALKLGRSKRWREVTLDQIRYFAAHAGIPERPAVQAVTETVVRFRAIWSAQAGHADRAGCPARREALRGRHRRGPRGAAVSRSFGRTARRPQIGRLPGPHPRKRPPARRQQPDRAPGGAVLGHAQSRLAVS